MATNRKRNDDKPVINPVDSLRTVLFSAITSHPTAEIALLHMMKTHDFDMYALQQILRGYPSFFVLYFGADLVRISFELPL
jgi:hypothetical protein